MSQTEITIADDGKTKRNDQVLMQNLDLLVNGSLIFRKFIINSHNLLLTVEYYSSKSNEYYKNSDERDCGDCVSQFSTSTQTSRVYGRNIHFLCKKIDWIQMQIMFLLT